MIQEVETLIKMAKIAVERIDSGLALGERLDVSPLRQAIFDAEQALEDYEEGYTAGIKEVAEWVGEYVTNQSINPTIFPRTAWQSKLKEWGI